MAQIEDCGLPIFSGFSIECVESNVILNVQDTNGNLIDGANVQIDCAGSIASAVSDVNGCVRILIKPNLVCDVTITKADYQQYDGKIMLVPESSLADPTKNFVFRVQDNGGIPVNGAAVSITSLVHADNGSTNSSGIFEGTIETNYTNNLTITAGGFQPFNQQFESFIPFECESSDFRVIPVITLQV